MDTKHVFLLLLSYQNKINTLSWTKLNREKIVLDNSIFFGPCRREVVQCPCMLLGNMVVHYVVWSLINWQPLMQRAIGCKASYKGPSYAQDTQWAWSMKDAHKTHNSHQFVVIQLSAGLVLVLVLVLHERRRHQTTPATPLMPLKCRQSYLSYKAPRWFHGLAPRMLHPGVWCLKIWISDN